VISASKHYPTKRFQNGDFGSFVVNDRLPSCQATLEGRDLARYLEIVLSFGNFPFRSPLIPSRQ
jgi:hypothetical protein